MQRRKKSKHSVVPEVGVFVAGKLWTDATPIANAETYGDSAVHQPGHGEFWMQLVQAAAVQDTEYEEHQRHFFRIYRGPEAKGLNPVSEVLSQNHFR